MTNQVQEQNQEALDETNDIELTIDRDIKLIKIPSSSKLNYPLLQEIKNQFLEGKSNSQIEASLGLRKGQISTWAHINNNLLFTLIEQWRDLAFVSRAEEVLNKIIEQGDEGNQLKASTWILERLGKRWKQQESTTSSKIIFGFNVQGNVQISPQNDLQQNQGTEIALDTPE
jgi:hypothetical protein